MIYEFPKNRFDDDRIFIDLSKITNITSSYSGNDVFTINIEFQLKEKSMIICSSINQYMTENEDNKYAEKGLLYREYFDKAILNPLLKAWEIELK